MKTITGYLAILLGAVGLLVTLAIIGAAWWGAFKLSAQTQQITTKVDENLVQIGDSCTRLNQQLATTTASVEAARVAAEKAADDRPNTPARRAEVERVRSELLPLTDRADAISESLPPIAQMIENAANLAEQGGSQPRADRLHAIAGKVRDAAKELDAVRTEAAAIREGKSTPTARDLANLAEQTRKSLDHITAALSDMKQESETLRKDLPEARQAVEKWALIGPAILTGVLLWVALGQLAIIAWGRRRLAPIPPAPAPQVTTR